MRKLIKNHPRGLLCPERNGGKIPYLKINQKLPELPLYS